MNHILNPIAPAASSATIIPHSIHSQGNPHAMQSQSPTDFLNHLVVIDSSVQDYQLLVESVVSGAKVLVLNYNRNAIAQITEALRYHAPITHLHMVAHGSPGCLVLGSTSFSLDTLERYAFHLRHWFSACLRPQILLYGCNVAVGDAGVEFIEKLRYLTGAEIAASSTPIGHASLGGNWHLDVSTDAIGSRFQVQQIFDLQAIATYPHTLAIDLASPTTAWIAVPPGGTNQFDFTNDEQANNDEGDLVGSATDPMFYLQFDNAGVSSNTDGTLAFRVRIAGDTGSGASGFGRNLFIGVDADGNGDIDLFITVNRTGSNNQIALFNPGTGANDSPATTSIDNANPLKVIPIVTTGVGKNLDYSQVTNGVTGNDPNATSIDLFGGTPDYFVSFSVPFQDIVNALTTLGITGVSDQSPVRFLVSTATQDNSLNQDIGGVQGVSGTQSYLTSGAFTQLISFNGTVPNIPPTITSNGGGATASITIPENTTSVTDVQSTDSVNSEGNGLVYSITGGADFSQFSINSSTGELSFIIPPNFDLPIDSGSDNLYEVQVTVTDAGGGTDIQMLQVTVTDVNSITVLDLDSDDSSNVSGVNYKSTFTEGSGAVAIADSDVVITDADDVNISSATIKITNPLDGALESLSVNGALPSGITASSYNPATGSLTLTGVATLADYQSAIAQIQYNNTSVNPATLDRIITVIVNDGMANSDIATTTLSVISVNSAATIDLDGNDSSTIPGSDYQTSFTEGGSAIAIGDVDVTITDTDDTNIESATVTLTNPLDGALETLAVGGSLPGGIIASSYNSGTGVLTLTGSATLAAYQTAIAQIQYNNASGSPDTTNRVITIVINDGDTVSNTAKTTITVSAVDSPPVLDLDANDSSSATGSNYKTSFTEGGSAIAIGDIDTVVGDVDSPSITSATLTLTNPLDGALETLAVNGFLPSGIIASSYNPATGILTLTGSGTAAEYQAAIAQIQYNNTSANPNIIDRTITVVINDGILNSSAATTTIAINAVNSTPTLDLDGDNSSTAIGNNYKGIFTEGGAAIAIADFDTAIADIDDTNIESATITLTNPLNGVLESLAVNGSLPTGIIASSYNPVTGILTLTGSATLSNYQTAIAQIQYNNTSANPAVTDRVITVTTNDGTANSSAAASTITIAAVNNAPVLDLDSNNSSTVIGNDYKTSFTEGGSAIAIGDIDILINDVDNTSIQSASITLTNPLDGGLEALSINGVLPSGIAASSYNSSTGILSLTGNATLADYQTAITQVRYNNTSLNPTATDRSITVVTNDGTADSNAATTTIAIIPINSAPTLDLDADNSSALGDDYTTSFRLGVPVAIADVDALITDVDDTNIESATLTLMAAPDGSSESLELTSAALAAATAAGITIGAYNPATRTLTLTGSAPLSVYQTILTGATYSNTDVSPDRSDRTITITVNDGNLNSITASTTIRNDQDGDGVFDAIDLDDDNDGISDTLEQNGNPNRDTDGDGILDRLDLDSDNDGITDLRECGLASSSITALDANGDGAIDLTNPFGANGLANTIEVSADSGTLNYTVLDTDGDGVRDFQDLDSDNDGLNDVVEAGGKDLDRNGLIDDSAFDTDADGLADAIDPTSGTATPGTPVPIPDTDGDGTANFRDLDSDNDGLPDLVEGGQNPAAVDLNGDGVLDSADGDGDGIVDFVDGLTGFGDNNGLASNNLPNSDADLIPNYLELDSNNDGTPDRIEAGLTTGLGSVDVNADGKIDNPADADKDGIPDSIDSKPGIFGGLEDTDGDGLIDAIDLDDDNDGITDVLEQNGNPNRDTDGDGVVDALDLDSDNDGITDLRESGLSASDIATLDTNGDGAINHTRLFGINGLENTIETTPDSGALRYTLADTDGDGIFDFQDLDSDNDGLNDVVEAGGTDLDGNGLIDGAGNDTDGDGLADEVDPINGAATPGTALFTPDTDSDGAADFRDLDSDNDGLPDLIEGGLNPATVDTNGDGVVDGADPDGDGILSPVDGLTGFGDSGSASNTLPNADGDSTPNYLELDSDNDGTPDRLEAGLSSGAGTPDANGDGKIDNPADADHDGIPDSIDSKPGVFGGFEDNDGDGILYANDLDNDNDGITDLVEQNGNPNRDTDGDGIVDALDLDSDNDGITDLRESGLMISVITALDTNGDGAIDQTNVFGTNGLADTIETIPGSGTLSYTVADTDGDSIRDFQELDSDNDGLNDVVEAGGTDLDGNGLIDGAGTDTDRDGLADAIDPTSGATPGSPLSTPDTDSDGASNFRDLDSDNDGLPDLIEGGLAPNLVDANNDGVIDGSDTDGDGIRNPIDSVNGFGNSGAASNSLPNADGDGTPDYLELDSDNDGIPDRLEAGLPSGAGSPDADSNGQVDTPIDTDKDGIPDSIDSKPGIFGGLEDYDGDGVIDAIDLDDDNDGITDVLEQNGNPNRDTDGDGVVDSFDLDSDNDGITDLRESGLTASATTALDANGDGAIDPTNSFGTNGLADAVETTPDNGTINYTTADTDGDSVRDFQDLDSDNDGLNDVVEAGGRDLDGNGLIDGAGIDIDGDGLADRVDPTNGNANPGTTLPLPDTDGDEAADFRDLDSDNDGLPDLLEGGLNPSLVDTNSDGVVDGTDTDSDGIPNSVDSLTGFGDNNGSTSSLSNVDGDSIPDYQELDSDNDGTPDRTEAGLPTGTGTPDADKDGRIDAAADTDRDGIADSIDSAPGLYGGFEDSDGDRIPNVYDLDDDNDGIPDLTEQNGNPTRDTDGDGILDSLDQDADNDGITDLSESGLTAAQITALDTNGDGVIDATNTFGQNGLVDAAETIPDSGILSYAVADTDKDGIRDFQDLDSDNDGINDSVEKTFDTDGDGAADFRDLDSDNDGLPDLMEAGFNPDLFDQDRNGVIDGTDTDGDGIRNLTDGIPNLFGDSPAAAPPDADGDQIPDYRELDRDNDGISDRLKAELPTGAGTPDADSDGKIDNPTDADQDGIADSIDAAPGIFGGFNFKDTDGDRIPDSSDLDDDNDGIPDLTEGAEDTDHDGILDSLDRDSDNDGILDVTEAGGIDNNGDGVIDSFVDTDRDGLADQVDPNNGGVPLPVFNTDGDRVPDYRDLDSDNDGLSDVLEAGGSDPDGNGLIGNGVPIDSDRDGVADSLDPDNGGRGITPPDQDGDRRPNYLDLDSDNDGTFDIKELEVNPSRNRSINELDANGDGKVDGVDLDGDGLIDVIDGDSQGFGSNRVNLPTFADKNGNGIPDTLEPPRTSTGSQGSDNIFGGNGNDILNGFSDLDILRGGDGDDIINGGSDRDTLRGDAGNDILNGGSNDDDMDGGTGNDILNGGTGNDLMIGGSGNDTMNGGVGKDLLRGGEGDDTLTGSDDRDRLYGDAGRDTIRGDRGNDIIVGGFEQDKLTGGQGRDRFVYQTTKDVGDVITDFEIIKDRIDLRQFFRKAGSMDNVHLKQKGNDTLVQVTTGGGFKPLATLQDVNADTITARHFIF
jgi:hypothetical protein